MGHGTSAALEPSPCTFSSGGVQCHGWLYRPPDPPPHPCVVLAHGFGADPTGPLGPVARRFVEAGLAAFTFDYRGFGHSDGEPRGLIDMERRLADWAAAISFVRSRSELDGARIALWGSSLSGGEVIAVAARDPSIAAVVSQVPYCDGLALARAAGVRHHLRMAWPVLSDLVRSALGRPPYLVDWLGAPTQRAALSVRFADLYGTLRQQPWSVWSTRVPARSILGVYRFRPVLEAERVRCPLLVVISYDDRVMPSDATVRTAERLPYAEMAMFNARHFDLYVGEVAPRAHDTEANFLNHQLLGRRVPTGIPTGSAAA